MCPVCFYGRIVFLPIPSTDASECDGGAWAVPNAGRDKEADGGEHDARRPGRPEAQVRLHRRQEGDQQQGQDAADAEARLNDEPHPLPPSLPQPRPPHKKALEWIDIARERFGIRFLSCLRLHLTRSLLELGPT